MAVAKCAHPGCSCLPAPELTFCSTQCELVVEEKVDEPIGCTCGHSGCDPRGQVRNLADVLGSESRH